MPTNWSDLHILTPAKRPIPTLQAVESLFRLESFWYGAILARTELYTRVQEIPTMNDELFHHKAIDNLEMLAVLARNGYDVVQSTEYRHWLEWRLKKEVINEWTNDYYSRKRDI